MDGEENKALALDEDSQEEVPQIDPRTLKPDLYAAAAANDIEKVAVLLDEAVPATFIEIKTGYTPLHWAAIHGNVRMLKKLLDGGASEPYHRLKGKEKQRRLEESSVVSAPGSPSKHVHMNDESGGEEQQRHTGGGEVGEVGGATAGGTIGDQSNSLEGEDADDEEEYDVEKELEIGIDLLSNTPLLWATSKGYLNIIWHLLADGYSPNDQDNMGNNSVHLAAAGGDMKILKVLLDDGGSANLVNLYKNLPVDMAKNKEIRIVLLQAMETGASMTEEDVANKHEANMKQYHRMINNLSGAISEASRMNSPRNIKNLTVSNSNKLMAALSESIAVAKDFSLDEDSIMEGERLYDRMELSQELITDIMALQKLVPIRSESVYIENAYKLERSIERASAADLDPTQLQLARDLISRCQMDYWVSVCLARLINVTVADESNEHDMNRLRQAVTKAQALKASEQVIDEASKLLGRWEAELGMSRAVNGMPVTKLPMADAPPGYWTENDVGSIKQTEGYPLPPADNNGEYLWIPSEAYTQLVKGIERIKISYEGSEELGANPSIIAEAKEMLTKAEKDLKILDVQDAKDKAAAIEVAKKAAKKLKKGKKK